MGRQRDSGNRKQEAGDREYRFRKAHAIAERLLDLTDAVVRLDKDLPGLVREAEELTAILAAVGPHRSRRSVPLAHLLAPIPASGFRFPVSGVLLTFFWGRRTPPRDAP